MLQNNTYGAHDLQSRWHCKCGLDNILSLAKIIIMVPNTHLFVALGGLQDQAYTMPSTFIY